MGEWISVKDRLPEDIGSKDSPYVRVLACLDNGVVFVSVFDYRDETWQDDCDCELLDSSRVTHWQPLPKLPKDQFGESSEPADSPSMPPAAANQASDAQGL